MTVPTYFNRAWHLEEINRDIEIICRTIQRLEAEMKRPNIPYRLIYDKEKKVLVYSDMLRDLAQRKKELIKQIEEDKQ